MSDQDMANRRVGEMIHRGALERAARIVDDLIEHEIEDGHTISVLRHVARSIRALKEE
jgi:hypothetical protein